MNPAPTRLVAMNRQSDEGGALTASRWPSVSFQPEYVPLIRPVGISLCIATGIVRLAGPLLARIGSEPSGERSKLVAGPGYLQVAAYRLPWGATQLMGWPVARWMVSKS
jgi:hypothetical protein